MKNRREKISKLVEQGYECHIQIKEFLQRKTETNRPEKKSSRN